MADFTASVNLIACNSGDKPTFERAYRRGVSESHIDITFVSEYYRNKVRNWRVLEEHSASLHNYISYDIYATGEAKSHNITERRWAWRKVDLPRLTAYFQNTEYIPSTETEEQRATQLSVYYMTNACDECMPKGTYKGGKKPVYWWSEDTADLRRQCLGARRTLKRSRKKAILPQKETDVLGEAYRDACRRLKIAIRRSKQHAWKDLCKQVDTDPWGLPYKIVTKKIIGKTLIPELNQPGFMEYVVRSLFPTAEIVTWPRSPVDTDFPEVTIEEITTCTKCIPQGKAPGPDGIPDMIIKQLGRVKPELLKSVFNQCFTEGVFPGPSSWHSHV